MCLSFSRFGCLRRDVAPSAEKRRLDHGYRRTPDILWTLNSRWRKP